jgi:hypothetical protein
MTLERGKEFTDGTMGKRLVGFGETTNSMAMLLIIPTTKSTIFI